MIPGNQIISKMDHEMEIGLLSTVIFWAHAGSGGF